MTIPSSAKRDIQRLQRAIVDGLEEVKAQDIRVFNTEHLSPLFERVVIATGSSNRQTRALAASVKDSVREAGYPKPRVEGEQNGEWIIVDCGAAVAHVMQPAIRQYYQLEEIWGDKAVRLKFGAPVPVKKIAPPAVPASTSRGKAAAGSRRKGAASEQQRPAQTSGRARVDATVPKGRIAGGKSSEKGGAAGRTAAAPKAKRVGSERAVAATSPKRSPTLARKP